jgi:uncharacterized protein YceK
MRTLLISLALCAMVSGCAGNYGLHCVDATPGNLAANNATCPGYDADGKARRLEALRALDGIVSSVVDVYAWTH